MKVVLTTLGKFHSFDLARQLQARGALQAIFSGYPRFKLRGEDLPEDKVRTFPYLHAPYMASGWRDRFGTGFLRQWEWWDRTTLDRHVASRLPQADIFVGLSGCGLATGRVARGRGMKFVCDRGSTHIRHQDDVLREEHARAGLPYAGIDPRIMDREEAEYALADLVTVPSAYVRDTFLARGIDPGRVEVLSYGVDLQRFQPLGKPAGGRLDLLFVGSFSLRKGGPRLLEAYAALRHPGKSLTIAGTVDEALVARMRSAGLVSADIRWLGHVPQPELKALMSVSHALVLPSVEEGLAMVMAQALACGCPVVASRATGAEDLYQHGVEGLILDACTSIELTRALERLADDVALQRRMRLAAVQRVQAIGGWARYGDHAHDLYARLLSTPARRADMQRRNAEVAA